MEVLSENRRILCFVGLGADNDVLISGKQIPRKLIVASFVLVQLLFISIAILLIVSNISGGIAALLLPVCLLLSSLSGLLVYVSLLVKRKSMSELFSYLQKVVDKSNAHIKSIFFCKFKYSKLSSESQFKLGFSIIRRNPTLGWINVDPLPKGRCVQWKSCSAGIHRWGCGSGCSGNSAFHVPAAVRNCGISSARFMVHAIRHWTSVRVLVDSIGGDNVQFSSFFSLYRQQFTGHYHSTLVQL